MNGKKRSSGEVIIAVMVVILLLFVCYIVIKSQKRPDYESTRKIHNTLLAVSPPYTYTIGEEKAVTLVWKEPQSVTTGGKFFEKEWIATSLWQALPIEKIPSEFIGKYVNQEVEISYEIVSLEEVPVVEIIDFTIFF